jgi:hypothetical protein
LRTEEVVSFLREVMEVEEEEANRVGGLSQGSIGRGLRLLSDPEGPGALERLRLQALSLLEAALSPTPQEIYRTSLAFNTTGARGLAELLDLLEEWLRDLAMAASGGEGRFLNPDGRKFFLDVLDRADITPPRTSGALRAVAEARRLASGNANPQLLVFGLLQNLRSSLLEGPATRKSKE